MKNRKRLRKRIKRLYFYRNKKRKGLDLKRKKQRDKLKKKHLDKLKRKQLQQPNLKLSSKLVRRLKLPNSIQTGMQILKSNQPRKLFLESN